MEIPPKINPNVPLRRQLRWRDRSAFREITVAGLPIFKLDEITRYMKKHKKSSFFYGHPRVIWEQIIKEELKLRYDKFAARDAKLMGILLAMEGEGLETNDLLNTLFSKPEVEEARKTIHNHLKTQTHARPITV